MKKSRAPFERYAGETVTTTARYVVPLKVIKAIQDVTPDHGSQGRAMQVATEILIRRKIPVRVKSNGDAGTRMTYKLLPRTIDLIGRLTKVYGDDGAVFAACVSILNEKV